MRIPVALAVIGSLLSGCISKPAEETPAPVTFTASEAPEWSALFNRPHGWFGGDGVFLIPFSGNDVQKNKDDSTLFLFSDTMVGDIDNGVLRPDYKMINNSVMVLHGDQPVEEKAKFLYNDGAEKKPTSLFVPVANKEKDDYYWMGDGFVNDELNGSMCIFAFRIRNTNDKSGFPFKEVGNDLIVIPAGDPYPFKNQRQLEIPFSYKRDSVSVSYGAAALYYPKSDGGDGYVYTYGVRGPSKEMLAARVKASSIEKFDSYEFYDGSVWKKNSADAKAIADSVSNELSVTRIGKNQYALIYQYAGLMPQIYMQIGPTPVGPFGPRQLIWNTTNDIKDKDLFTYNAKAHPAISVPGELLISYNVNSFKFFEIIGKMPNVYRPRFIRVVFDKASR